MTTMHKTAFKLNARSKSLIPGLLLALVKTLPALCAQPWGHELKAIIQQYMERMTQDRLLP